MSVIKTDTSFRIRQVDPSDVEGIDRLTALHMELLGFGPMAQFGDRFIREMVYEAALREHTLQAAVAEVDGEPVGFIAYTTQPNTFHHSLMKGSKILKAGWIIGTSLLMNPKRILRLPRAVQVVFSRNDLPESFEKIETEVVCFGVRPEFLTPAFVRQNKLRIGVLLIEHAFDYFRQEGFTSTRMIVDADNPRPLMFYQSMGGTFTPCVFGGVPSYVVQFDL